MKSKKQQLRFGGINKFNEKFITHSFDFCATESKFDPRPMNRKSKRAIPKLIKNILAQTEKLEKEYTEQEIKEKKIKRRQRKINQNIQAKKLIDAVIKEGL